MDYLLKKPIEHEGKVYDIALFHLSSAPVIKGNDYSMAVNLQIVPARKTGETVEMLRSHAIRVEQTADIKRKPTSQNILAAYAQVSEAIVGLTVDLNIIQKPE